MSDIEAVEAEQEIPELTEEELQQAQVDQLERHFVHLASEAYTQSTTWLDIAMRNEWERNVAHFNNRFPKGSKYLSDAYKRRSKIFKPKTRSGIRNNEAAFAAAMFSSADLVNIDTDDDNDRRKKATADYQQAAMQHYLTNEIPWFQTAVGAFQDACVYGVAVSYQYWDFRERKNDSGETIVVKDKPCIDLMPPENLRIDPAADWRNPIKDSPYVIRIVPMYAADVLDRMSNAVDGDPQAWRSYTLGEVLSASKSDYNTTKRAREEDRPDSEDNEDGEFSTVYCHENFIRLDGEEFVYWTLGTSKLLSDPVPLETAYWHGERPIVIGNSVIETHKTYPSGPATLSAPLQEAANDIQNQRFDNVQLVLNKRFFVRRGQQVDLDALMRNTPGGGVFVDDPERDIKTVSTPDITGSSYQEQDRLDVQIDEINGAFSQSTVQASRHLNETVGGMNLMSSGASAMAEYTIRTFVETWVEPVLRQVMKLIQHYESSNELRETFSNRADLGGPLPDEDMTNEVRLYVNVGIGSTNPQQKVERLMYGVNSVANLPGVPERTNSEEILKEVFGALGYKNGMRFFTPDEEGAQPQPSQEEIYAAAKQELDAGKSENAARKLEIEATKADMDYDLRLREIEMRREVAMADLAQKAEITLTTLYEKLQFDEFKNSRDYEMNLRKDRTNRQTTALRETTRQNEMALKREHGSGI